jgi:carbamoyl-phosphate synthase large subunit
MTKPKKILLLGSGGLKIGQAGEFDYSGSQAIKAFKEEGIKIVLMNPNIATVQTDDKLADTVYFLPLTIEFATQVIEKEKPDAISLSFGGQTALNLGLALEETGILKKHHVQVLGTPVSSIRDTEDRELFVQRLAEIEVKTAKSIATKNVAEAAAAAKAIGYPVMVRSGFALGGEGSGRVADEKALKAKLSDVFKSVSQVLVEEYLGGWKEVEYEVVRDSADNCITVCNMENIDPMGIHTGESIVVAPSQTLNNEEYHRLREVAIKTIRHLKIVGECNIQYALDPVSGDYRVIEVNARLSRSSALASKATGYPLAFVAAKLALGYKLTELKNSVTKKTIACFEPALDYLVLKMPRWDLTKFEGAAPSIGTEMKSVGEVMAIGRSFEEVLQKAMRMLNIGAQGFTAQKNGNFKIGNALAEIKDPTTRRIFALAQALAGGASAKKLHDISKIDMWFLGKMERIIKIEKELKKAKRLDATLLLKAKKAGFSDAQIATIRRSDADAVRAARIKAKILPSVKQIDTLAGEFPAQTNYLYMTYHGTEHDVAPSKDHIAVLGSGPYSIGSSVEFDWSCVQALRTLQAKKIGTIMINSNPETVSTDYDVSDRLYFDELSLERVLDIVEFERAKGVIVSTGGQIPNNLSLPLHERDVKVLGTSPEDINRAEDRHVFSKLEVHQPGWTEVTTPAAAKKRAKQLGYPVLVRPSYVLSGSAMKVAHDERTLMDFLKRAAAVNTDHPVVISKFVENAREIEIDGVAQGGKLVIYAISEHVENAGTHSGDATVVLPPQRTYLETIRRAKGITKGVVKALKITGPFNIQFLAKDNHLMVIECNVRASRSFPFVSKVTGHNFIDLAIRGMLGDDISGEYRTVELDTVAVKSPQFSYSRIKGADPTTSVEMGSTGEVACFGDSFGEALIKSMMAAGFRLPQKSRRPHGGVGTPTEASGNILLSLGGDENKVKLLASVERLAAMKYHLYATDNTAAFLRKHGIKCTMIRKKGKAPKGVLGFLESGQVDLLINIPQRQREGLDGFVTRRKAIDMNIPLITNRQLAEAFITALSETKIYESPLKSWAEYRE